MARSLKIWVVVGLAFAIAAPEAQALVRHPRHHVVHPVIRPGDIVVHARRSYLDAGRPGWAEVGTGNRYVGDAAPNSFADFGMPFAANCGFDLLPTRFNPPGRPEPLFQFSEP